jgi:hypothetical protein
MEKQGPMLEVNFSSLDRQPRCSICSEQFDAEGSAIDLLTAFVLHVREKHVHEDVSQEAVRIMRRALKHR